MEIAHSLPPDPLKLLDSGWEDITHPNERTHGSMTFREISTGLRVRFDKAKPNGKGFSGEDHYHILNPNTTSRRDRYLDINGNPVPKGSVASRILPTEDQ